MGMNKLVMDGVTEEVISETRDFIVIKQTPKVLTIYDLQRYKDHGLRWVGLTPTGVILEKEVL